jgi:hypothetical protein
VPFTEEPESLFEVALFLPPFPLADLGVVVVGAFAKVVEEPLEGLLVEVGDPL